MNLKLFKKRYAAFKITEAEMMKHAETILQFETYIKTSIEETSIEDIKKYVAYLISVNKNTYKNLIHIARYYYYIDMKDHYIHMTKYFNSHGVLENIISRINLYASENDKQRIVEDVFLPAFGTESDELPSYTKDFLEKLNKHLPKNTCNKILAGNNHGIPKETFDKEKEYYNNAESFESYLEERHIRKVAELQKHLDENKVWFEQIITEEVVEYVRSNPEVLSGVIEEDKLYITKIPFDTKRFLETEDDVLKRYYACHCTFVREAIKEGRNDIPKEWCYCSGGFAKFPFEQILDTELDITLLNTPLDGDYICRFEVDLSNVEYKK